MTKIEQELMAIETMIYIIRGQRVMIDNDLAALYGVETKVLNRNFFGLLTSRLIS